MDPHDSTGGPPQHHHSHHHHHQPSQHHHSGLVGPTPHGTQPQQQQPPTNSSYLLPNSNNSLTPATAMMHHHQQQQQQQQQQNPRFSFNSLDHHSQYSDGSPSGSGGGGAQWFTMEQPVAARKKRGRPRKYSPDNSIGLGLASPVSQNVESAGGGGGGGGGTGTPTSDGNPGKRHRGRPPGSGKRQMDALGAPGAGFTPHVITVEAGEDIASKITAFSQQGPRTVCILSANGAVCNVTLRQPAISGGTVTYEGRFEIISLSGSFQPSESNNNPNRSGVLSVSLAGSDGRVLGGGVAGMLKAASPIQVVVGSFIAEGKKPKTGSSTSTPPPPPSNMLSFGGQVGGTGASPTSADGGSSDSDDEENDDSPPLDRGSGPYNPNSNTAAGQQPIPQNIPMYSNMGGWPNSMKMHGP